MQPPIKLLFLFGTRPEAIKLAPLILAARGDARFESRVVVTAQHREMLDDVLTAFEIKPDADLNIMAPDQSLYHVTAQVFLRLEPVLERLKPDVMIVQGDTTTTFAGAVAGFYANCRIAHVEAGLRTGLKRAPYPEEMNRKMTSVVADEHFAPTEGARRNLLREGYPAEHVHVTGNTVIDALLWMDERIGGQPCPLPDLRPALDRYGRLVLITGHRRESFGEPMLRICEALRQLAIEHPDTAFVYPVHLNPNVQRPVREILGGLDNFMLLPPLAYPEFTWLMHASRFIITDSGGVQEEAPSLHKPVLVTRQTTERPEAVEAGVARLVGNDGEQLLESARRLLNDEAYFNLMATGANPYGDGQASRRILDILARQ